MCISILKRVDGRRLAAARWLAAPLTSRWPTFRSYAKGAFVRASLCLVYESACALDCIIAAAAGR